MKTETEIRVRIRKLRRQLHSYPLINEWDVRQGIREKIGELKWVLQENDL